MSVVLDPRLTHRDTARKANDMEHRPGGSSAVSLSGGDATAPRGHWDALSDGATVAPSQDRAPWRDWFGMLIDRFRIGRMVDISGRG